MAAANYLVRFGVISDVQFANIDNRLSFVGKTRHYRNSLELLRKAVQVWNEKPGLSFAMHLGDIVDGFAGDRVGPDATEQERLDEGKECIESVIAEFNKFKSGTVYHIIGNHCLYNMKRDSLNKALGIADHVSCQHEGCSFYEYTPHPRVRIVVLDAYDISLLGWPEGHPKHEQAKSMLSAKNSNPDKNSPVGLEGTERRWVKFNGALGAGQLQWLEQTLAQADKEKQVVLVCSHVPLHPKAANPIAIVWNYDEVLPILESHPCVVATLCGHDHDGGYFYEGGVHHITLEGIIECGPDITAHGVINVCENSIVLEGFGKTESNTFEFHHRGHGKPAHTEVDTTSTYGLK